MTSDDRKPLDIKIGAAIKKARKARGLVGREVAEQFDISTAAVGNWERGANAPTSDKLAELADFLRMDLKALMRGEYVSAKRSALVTSYSPDDDDSEYDFDVPVVGYVGAGAGAHYYQVEQGELERVSAPKGAKKTTAALEIRGDSLGPLLNRWIVYYDDAQEVSPEHLGQLCIVSLPDDRVLVKQIVPSRKFKGLFDLKSNLADEPVIEGVEIIWAALVTDIKRRG